ncbi:MAG TPA: PQQ-dependent sugar dehydrogenase [Longimicrobiaceae bacterium]|nr:PQQ-dependent sugar dehydrogenase [Longimicrobiaceae bacterium]
MIRARVLLLCLAAACSSSTTDTDPPPPPVLALRLVEVASGLTSPLYLTAPPGDARLFVVEQAGRIRVVENGQLLATPFLDLVGQISSGGERGLLSVAFHPRYSQTGFFYVNYTDPAGHTRVVRYRVSADPNRADPASAQLVLMVEQPFSNHNGGLVLFGPDGMLYVGMGDGGSAGDPLGHGQNPGTLLGDILRLDVDRAQPYSVPPDNPFVGQAGKREEIWAMGVRNPWRFAFDRQRSDLYVADVGQNAWEEVSVVPGGEGGANLGWKVMEGTRCFSPSAGCSQTGLLLPVLEYSHAASACSITGGFVYRGTAMAALRGHYFYSDYCGGWLRSFRYFNGAAVDQQTWNVGSVGNVTSFGEDAAGELYMTSTNGRVYRIAPQ